MDNNKKPFDEYQRSCEALNLTCREGYECFCKPCIKAQEVDVFVCFHSDDYVHEERHLGCPKMGICGTVEQTKGLQFRAEDQLLRPDSQLNVVMHLGGQKEIVPIIQVDDHRWKFNWTSDVVGVVSKKCHTVSFRSYTLSYRAVALIYCFTRP